MKKLHDINFSELMPWVSALVFGYCWYTTASFWAGIIGTLIFIYPIGLLLVFALSLLCIAHDCVLYFKSN